jgi:hypothetical protein
MNALKTLVKARWFPTVTKPILSGLAASGIVYLLHAVGITSFTNWEVNSAVAPLVGFLIAAIVQREGGTPTPVGTVQAQVTVATHTTTYKPGETLGKTIAQTFLDDIAQEIDANPELLQTVAAQAFQRVMNPQQATVVAAASHEIVTTGN